MKFVIIHGSFGHPQEHWFPIVKEKLEALGQSVVVPKFPCSDWDEVTKAGPKSIPKDQNIELWFKVFEKEILVKYDKKEKYCFIGHSIGPVFILHLAEKYNLQMDSAIFVSPFMERINPKNLFQFDVVNQTYYKTDFNFEKLNKLIPVSYVLYSQSDIYVDRKFPLTFAQKMNSSVIEVNGAGHLNHPYISTLVYELCKTRLESSVYENK